MGLNAGRYLADDSTANQTSNNSVFLGYDTRANGAGQTNQIVIGAGAIGAGSNSVTLGNTSITKTLLQGNVYIPTTTGTTPYGIIYKDSDRFIHNFNYGNNGTVTTEGQNTFLGINAGNFTMGSTATQTYHASYNTGIGMNALLSNTTGYNNSAMGYAALYANTSGYSNSAIGMNALYSNTSGNSNSAMGAYALRINTTGYNNSAIGASALYSNTTGYHNSAMGVNALLANTTGYNNSAIGMDALYSNTSGTNNSAMGLSALYFNTTGYYNSAMGRDAGRYLANGSTANQTSNTSVFLGYDTRANGAGQTNQIVIGASAIGLGSNTVVLGNSSITTTRLQGNIGNVDSPSARLHIRGAGTTSSTLGLLVEDSAGTAGFTVRGDGAFAFKGGTVGLAQSGYTLSNYSTRRTLDGSSYTQDQLKDLVLTFMNDMTTKGIITT